MATQSTTDKPTEPDKPASPEAGKPGESSDTSVGWKSASAAFDDVILWIDHRTNGFIAEAGAIVHFGWQGLTWVGNGLLSTLGFVRNKAFSFRETIKQMEAAGTQSFAIIALVAFLVGLTLVLQTVFVLESFGQKDLVSSVVAVSFVRELGPLITAIIFTGRVGAAYTAELGTMKVQEEILALQTMGINPIAYLVAPRFFAAVAMLPALSILAIFVGIFGGYLIGVNVYGIGNTVYIENARQFLDMDDVFFGAIKSIFFAGVIVTISCYKGFNVRGGGEEVGRATMQAVVLTLVTIIFSDTVWTLMYNIYQGY